MVRPHSSLGAKNVIRIPPIVRRITRESHQVKKLLGLKTHEKFSLYYTGVKGVKWEYKYQHDLEKTLCDWDLSLPLVIIHGLGTNIKESVFKGNNFINIQYDPEGQDYVNAAEFIIAKPGMSLFSECVAYNTPLLMCKPDHAETELKSRIYRRILDIEPPIVDSFDVDGIFSKVDYLFSNMERFQSSFEKIKCNGAEIVANSILDIMEGLIIGYPSHKIIEGLTFYGRLKALDSLQLQQHTNATANVNIVIFGL